MHSVARFCCAANSIVDNNYVMYHNDGMAIMTKRTTFSFDNDTIQRIKRLSHFWNVSQAEAVRRAVEIAETETLNQQKSIAQELVKYHTEGGLASEKAVAYLYELNKYRDNWRDQ